METVSFKRAIYEWEYPFAELMIGYSALTRKANINPDEIFVIVYWDDEKNTECYRSFDVGLKKEMGRWVVNKNKFEKAVIEKIKAVEDTNRMGKTNIKIHYPQYYI